MNKYYAFNGIDKYIDELFFSKQKKGYFIDIGAHDGISGNNTFYFENEGWDGICFEPIPSVFKKLNETRKCKVVNKALSDKSGIDRFFVIDGHSEQLSGLVSEYSEDHIIRINREIEEHNQNFEYIDVECTTFSDEVDIINIDLLSLDTEGSEFSILKTIDFDKYKINVIILEYNYHNQSLIDLLNNNGFEIVNKIGCDLIIKNKNYVY